MLVEGHLEISAPAQSLPLHFPYPPPQSVSHFYFLTSQHSKLL